MDEQTITEASKTTDEIQDLLLNTTSGANAPVIRRLLLLTHRIESAVPFAGYECGAVMDWAEILFSAKRHTQWGEGGVEKVRQFALQACASLSLKLSSATLRN